MQNKKNISRQSKRIILLMVDILIIGFGVSLAFGLRFDIFTVPTYLQIYQTQLLLFFPVKIFLFWVIGLYRAVLRFTGMEYSLIVLASVFSSNMVLFGIFDVFSFPALPRSILILDALICFLLIMLSRFFIRWIVYVILPGKKASSVENVLIYGAGETGSQLAQSISTNPDFRLFAFIDDDPQLKKHAVGGVRVYNKMDIGGLVEKYKLDSILLAMPSLTKKNLRILVDEIQEYNLAIKIVPSLNDLLSEKVTISNIHGIDIIDLLGRDEIAPHQELLHKNVTGASVLITGAGGSIGSELCRQVAVLEPTILVLLERSEFALYTILMDIKEQYPDLNVVGALGSMGDQNFVAKLLREHKVDTLFHAAAYKHVPLVEANAKSGVDNNIFGSLACVLAAEQEKVKNFVLISTDKAVRPTNIMGTSKRVTELIVQAKAASPGHHTKYTVVRFGNVLGSTGSVVPRFSKQIAEGKDITLTHPDITRYFMSVSEAARLVIQASALGEGGEIYLLDMGEPIKIYDLAKEMISLSGLTLGDDIKIEITGLRPGEKLYEELLINPKHNRATEHPKIFHGQEPFYSWEELGDMLSKLNEDLPLGAEAIREALKKIVPEYQIPTK